MKIKTFATFEDAKDFAEKNEKEVALFSLKNGQQDFEWKRLGTQFEAIDLMSWLQEKNSVFKNAEDFIDFSLEFLREDLKNGEVTQDVFDKREREVSEIVEEFKKYPDGFIVHHDMGSYDYVEPHRYVMNWYDDEGTTFAVGVEETRNKTYRRNSDIER